MKKIKIRYFKIFKAQALLELTILASIFLFLLSMLVQFGVSMNKRQDLMMKAFRYGVKRASSDSVGATYMNYVGQFFKDIPMPDPQSASGVPDLQEITASAQSTRTFLLNNPISGTRDGLSRMQYVLTDENGQFQEPINPQDNTIQPSDWRHLRANDAPDNADTTTQYNNRPKTGVTVEGVLHNVPMPEVIVRNIPDPWDQLPKDGAYWTWMAFCPLYQAANGDVSHRFLYLYGVHDLKGSDDKDFGNGGKNPYKDSYSTPITSANVNPSQSYDTIGYPAMIMGTSSYSGMTSLSKHNYKVKYSFAGSSWKDIQSSSLFRGIQDQPILGRGVQIWLDPQWLVNNVSKITVGDGTALSKILTANPNLISDFTKQGSVFTIVALHGEQNADGSKKNTFVSADWYGTSTINGGEYGFIDSMDLSSPLLADVNMQAVIPQGVTKYTLESENKGTTINNVKKGNTYSTRTNVNVKDTINREITYNPASEARVTMPNWGGKYNVISVREKQNQQRYYPPAATPSTTDYNADTGWQVTN